MKYFKAQGNPNQGPQSDRQVSAQDQYMNEEGDMLDHGENL